MTYEYAIGMGTAREDAAEAYNRGNAHYQAGRYQQAYDEFARANRIQAAPAAVAAMGSSAAQLNRCAQAILHFREAISGGYTLRSEAQQQYDRCLEAERAVAFSTTLEEFQPSATTDIQAAAEPVTASEKQTWWTGDIGGMVDSFFNKLGIGQQAQQQAENTARVEGAVATASSGPTSISEVAPETAQAPTVTGGAGAATPWYVQYAPHMVIGGLGIGMLVTFVVILRRRW